MKRLHRRIVAVAGVVVLGLSVASPALAGQPGSSANPPNECEKTASATETPGKAESAPGSVFNAEGRAGEVYAGNEGTASLEHANSPHAVSQYDVACVQATK
jgi:hypothetical protein